MREKNYRWIYGAQEVPSAKIREILSAAFHIPAENIEDYKTSSQDARQKSSVWFDVLKHDFSDEFRFEFEFHIDTSLFSSKDENLQLAQKLAPFLGEPLIGDTPDYSKNECCYYKCYPDGRQERIEWPVKEEDDFWIVGEE